MRRRATVVALALALASVGTATLVAGAVVSWESYSDLDNQRGALETALAVAACVGPGTRVLLHPYRRPSLHDATDPANAGGINGRLSLVPLVDVPHLQASMSALAGVSVLASGVDPRSRLVVLELDARCRYTCAHARRLVQRYAASGVEPVFVPRLDYGVSEALFADVWRAVGVAPPVRAAPLLRTLASDLVARGVGARFSATHLRLGDAQPYALANCVPRIDGGDAASLQQVAVARGVACSFGGAASSPLYVDDVLRALAFNVSRAASLFVATNKPTSVRVHALRLEAAQHGVALLTLDDVLARSGAAARARYAALVAQTGSASVLRSALEQEMCVLADAYVPCALSSWDQYVLRERAAAPPSHVPRHGAYVRDAARVSSLDELRTLWRDRERASAARADYALFVEREQAVVLECEDERRPPKSWLLLVAALLVSVAVVPASAYAYVLFRRAAFASGARAPRAHEFVARLCVAHGVLTLVECALLPTRSRAAPLIVESRLVVTALVSAAALAHAAPAWIVRAGVALVFAMSALAARALRTRAATGGALVRVLVDWRYGQEPGHVVREVVATALVCGCAAGMVALAGASAPLAGASSPSWSLARVRRDRGRAAALFAQLVLVSLALAARSCYLLASTLADDVLDVARLVLELAVLALSAYVVG